MRSRFVALTLCGLAWSTTSWASPRHPVAPLPSLSCLSLKVTDQQAMDPRFVVPLYEKPSLSSQVVGRASAIVLAKNPMVSRDGFIAAVLFNGANRVGSGERRRALAYNEWVAWKVCSIPDVGWKYRIRHKVVRTFAKAVGEILVGKDVSAASAWHKMARCSCLAVRHRRVCERRGRRSGADRNWRDWRCRGDCVRCGVYGLTATPVNRHASGRGRVAADADRLGSAADAAWPCSRMRAPGNTAQAHVGAFGVYMMRGPTRVGRPPLAGRIRRAGLLR